MDLVLKGRGVRITDQLRRTAELRFAKITRLDARLGRVEVEIIEGNPREGGHRVEVACQTRRRVFRAEGASKSIESALDQAAEHIERQIASYRGKLRNRWMGRGNRPTIRQD